MPLDGVSGSGRLHLPTRRAATAAGEATPAQAQDQLALGAKGPAPRTAADAAREAEQVFFTSGTTATVAARVKAAEANDRAAFEAAGYAEVGLGTQDYREVLRDAEHVNRDRMHKLLREPAKEAEARRQVAASAALEAAALAAMPEADRRAFDAVARSLNADPTARLALQMLLLDGKLPGDADRKGGTLLTNLAGLAAPGATHEAIPAGELLADLVQEIHLPSAISQQDASTCTATTLQILLAKTRPAEYVRLVAGLASPAGVVPLGNGDMLVREPGTEKALPFLSAEGAETPDVRSHGARVFQAALMEYADGEAGYDPQRDRHTTGLAGMDAPMMAKALAGLGTPAGTVHDLRAGTAERMAEVQDQLKEARAEKDPVKAARLSIAAVEAFGEIEAEVAAKRGAMLADVLAALDRGQAVPVAIAGWRGVTVAPGETQYVGAHALLATRAEGDFVYYINPHGSEERMTKAAFQARVGAALIPAAP